MYQRRAAPVPAICHRIAHGPVRRQKIGAIHLPAEEAGETFRQRRYTAARGLRFRSGTGSCVIDHYATVSAHYREIACLVQGSHASTVVVAAAVPHEWARLAPQLERAISSFAT